MGQSWILWEANHSLTVKVSQYSKPAGASCKPYELEQLAVVLARNLKCWSEQ